MPDTTLSTSGITGQSMKVIFWAPALVSGNLQAWNPTLGTPAFDTVNSGNWAQHLITVPEPGSLGVYTIDVSTISPALPTGIRVNPKFYNVATAGAQPFAEFPTVFWDGTSLAPTANVAQVQGTEASPGSLVTRQITVTSAIQ
jgi:hypothetical protein